MEYEDRISEVAIREEVVMLRELLERTHRHAGYLEAELRKREGDLRAIRASRPVEDGE